jgi:type II secretory pathway predicted ATPase ExeA
MSVILPDVLRKQQRLARRMQAGRAFIAATARTAELLLQLLEWLSAGFCGGVVWGPARTGKTFAVLWSLRQLQDVVGKVPWVHVPSRDDRLDSDRKFFGYLLSCCNSKYAKVGDISEMRDRLTKLICARAASSDINALILFIDEAQWLKETHLRWLMQVSNEVAKEGRLLFVLLVGTPAILDLQHKLSFSATDSYEHITTRFLLEQYEMKGLCSEQELRSCLEEFDKTKWPEGEEMPFPSHFISQAVAAGFTLASQAPIAWREFHRMASEAGLAETEVPMHYVTSTVLKLLQEMGHNDRASASCDESLVIKSVRSSGFSSSARIRLLSILREAKRKDLRKKDEIAAIEFAKSLQ